MRIKGNIVLLWALWAAGLLSIVLAAYDSYDTGPVLPAPHLTKPADSARLCLVETLGEKLIDDSGHTWTYRSEGGEPWSNLWLDYDLYQYPPGTFVPCKWMTLLEKKV
jgi:hypothetical protein